MKLSIILITYNHEKYIKECIESIIAQHFNFEWELVIAYDCSTDNTLSVLEEYRTKIKNFTISIQKNNVGIATNFADAIALVKGELLAIIDGDDYNLDDHKYIKQVAVFDNNPDVALCFANGYKFIEESGRREDFYNSSIYIPRKFDLSCFYRNNLIINPTTIMCRTSSLPDFYFKYNNVDWMLTSFCALKGKIFFLDEALSCYRIHDKSITRTTKSIDYLLRGKWLNEQMNEYLKYEYDWFLGNNSWYNEQLTYEYVRNREYRMSLRSALKYFSGKNKISVSQLRYFAATIYSILFKR